MGTDMTLVLVRDLMFSSKITAAARQSGTAMKIVRDPTRLAGETAERLIVDLNEPAALEAAAEWKKLTGGLVIGFVSHVDTETIARAKAAGLDNILSRGQFTQLLPDLLQKD